MRPNTRTICASYLTSLAVLFSPQEAISPARGEVDRASAFVEFLSFSNPLSLHRRSEEAHLQTLSTIQSEGIADRGGAIREHQTACLHARLLYCPGPLYGIVLAHVQYDGTSDSRMPRYLRPARH